MDVREFDERGGWHLQGARSCAHWLSWRVGWGLTSAREHVRVARKLAEVPDINDALRRGAISYCQVRAMTRVATPENQSLLLGYAEYMTGADLEKMCRKYAMVQRHCQDPSPRDDEQRRYVRRRDTEDGMVKIEVVLHPEEAELVWTMLDHAAGQLIRSPDVAAAPAAPAAPAGHGGDASAEARPVEQADPASTSGQAGAAAGPAGAAAGPAGVSAEARMLAERQDAASASGQAGADAVAADASAEARTVERELAVTGKETPQGRGESLLDLLLDESDALRSAEGWGVRSDSHGHAASVVVAQPATDLPIAAAAASNPGSLQYKADAAKRAFSRADALLSIAQGYLRGDQPHRAPIEVTLTIPEGSLRIGPAGSVCAGTADPLDVGELGGTFISREAARRLSCDAGVVEVIEDDQGMPLAVGRKRRTISGALKRALRKRDGRCTFPGCSHQLFLEGHHIQHWADGGETSLENAALLCSFHHMHVHEYGYTIELGPDQRPQFRDPRGRLVPTVPQRPAPVDLGCPYVWTMNASLEIDANTHTPKWDGQPVDYGALVGHLVVADGL